MSGFLFGAWFMFSPADFKIGLSGDLQFIRADSRCDWPAGPFG
jgi:hypothetical protein